MNGRFIAFEGIDGVGKDTQLKLLVKKLEEKNIKFQTFSFPQHGEPSAYFVDEYLRVNFSYGEPEEVGPYRASIFYALDRYDASFKLKKFLESGYLVVSDRYLASSIGHQGGKIGDNEEREKFVEWLFDLEYRILGIPKPNFNIIFRIPAEIAKRRLEAKKNLDAHEIDLEHLKKAQNVYLWAAKHYPEDFRVIKCFDEERELSPEEVHKLVWQIIENELKL